VNPMLFTFLVFLLRRGHCIPIMERGVLFLAGLVSQQRHRKVADCHEVADFIDARRCPQKTADIDGLRYSPGDPYYRLGPVHACLEVRVT